MLSTVSSVLFLLTLAFSVVPSNCQTNSTSNNATVTSDISVLNYALTLEHLEAAFYNQGLSRYNTSDHFTGADFANGTFENFERIRDHENTHVTALEQTITALGGNPVPACNYSFPYTNVQGFVALARALENTGVSAYTGVINEIHEGALLTAGATIATIEARHASYLNLLDNRIPFPAAFDQPLSPRGIVSIALQFITSCPFLLSIRPFAGIDLTPSSGYANQSISISPSPNSNFTLNANGSTYCAFLYSNGQVNQPLQPSCNCTVPADVHGDVFVLLLDGDFTVSLTNDTHVLAGPAVYEVEEPSLPSTRRKHHCGGERGRGRWRCRGR